MVAGGDILRDNGNVIESPNVEKAKEIGWKDYNFVIGITGPTRNFHNKLHDVNLEFDDDVTTLTRAYSCIEKLVTEILTRQYGINLRAVIL